MAEDITQEILRSIQADLSALRAGQARIEQEVRSALGKWAKLLGGCLEDIHDRLDRVESLLEDGKEEE